MVIYVYGADAFRSRRYVREQVQKFQATRDRAGYNIRWFDARQESFGTVMAEMKQAPFLANRRLVVVENPFSSVDRVFVQKIIQALEQSEIPQDTVALFWQGEKIPKHKDAERLHGLLRQEKYAQEFPPLAGSALAVWIKSEVISRGGAIELPAAQYLAETAEDMWALSMVIDQLVAWAHKRPIVRSDAEAFAAERYHTNIFALTETIVSGDRTEGLRRLLAERRAGAESGYIFAMIIRQLRLCIALASWREANPGLGAEAAARELNLHPFAIKKAWPATMPGSLPGYIARYDRLVDIDRQTKQGANQAALLELMVAAR